MTDTLCPWMASASEPVSSPSSTTILTAPGSLVSAIFRMNCPSLQHGDDDRWNYEGR